MFGELSQTFPLLFLAESSKRARPHPRPMASYFFGLTRIFVHLFLGNPAKQAKFSLVKKKRLPGSFECLFQCHFRTIFRIYQTLSKTTSFFPDLNIVFLPFHWPLSITKQFLMNRKHASHLLPILVIPQSHDQRPLRTQTLRILFLRGKPLCRNEHALCAQYNSRPLWERKTVLLHQNILFFNK